MANKREVYLDKSLRNLLMDGIASQIMFSLVTVSIISSYLASVNADPFIIGLVATISYISQLIQIPSALFAEKYSRKKFSLLANLVSRFSLFLIGIVLFIDLRSSILLLIVSHIRGEFYSKRIAYGKFVALFVVLAFTVLFSLLGKLAFPLLFFVAFVAGMVSVYFITGIDDVDV